jgi:hypothetical protein
MNVELILYNYMMSNVKTFESTRFLKIINSILPALNFSVYNGFISWVLGKRMSGEMCTSLGNGFTNIIILAYIVSCRGGDLIAVVEGDDSLFSSLGCDIKDEDFEMIGMVAKRERHAHIGLASFCGNVFHPEVQHVIADPKLAMCKLPCLNIKYRGAGDKIKMQLLKSKALSLAHQYPGCPVIAPLAHKILHELRSITVSDKIVNNMQSYKRYEYKRDVVGDIPQHDIDPRTRVIMEDAFGVTIQEQLVLEKHIASMSLQGDSALGCLMPWSWRENRQHNVIASPISSSFNPVARTIHQPPETEIPTGGKLRQTHRTAHNIAVETYQDALL